MVVGVKHRRKKKKVCRGERKEFATAILPLVRIWVRGEVESSSIGEGERFYRVFRG